MTLAWAFEDEAEGYADTTLEALSGGSTVVPDHWGYEVVNVVNTLIVGKRIMLAESTRFLTLLRSLPIEVEMLSFGGLSELASLAREYELSAYLGVAVRQRTPLATRELPLKEAARRSGAAVFGS